MSSSACRSCSYPRASFMIARSCRSGTSTVSCVTPSSATFCALPSMPSGASAIPTTWTGSTGSPRARSRATAASNSLEPGERRSRSLVECEGSMIETALPPIRKMMERAASSRSTRPRNSKSAEASNLAGMPFVEGPERILSHVHEEPPSPGHRRRPVLGEFPVKVVPGAEEVTRLVRRAPPPSRLLAEFLEAGERGGQFRQHSEESQRVLGPRAVFQLAPIEFSPPASQHDRERAQERSICAGESERQGKSCLR